MKIAIELSENDLKTLVMRELEKRLGDIDIDEKDVHIEVKSKQNYKSEWEEASFRARIDK